MVPLTNTGEG